MTLKIFYFKADNLKIPMFFILKYWSKYIKYKEMIVYLSADLISYYIIYFCIYKQQTQNGLSSFNLCSWRRYYLVSITKFQLIYVLGLPGRLRYLYFVAFSTLNILNCHNPECSAPNVTVGDVTTCKNSLTCCIGIKVSLSFHLKVIQVS